MFSFPTLLKENANKFQYWDRERAYLHIQPTVVSADGKIWVIGGKSFHDKEHRGTVEVFDGNEWRVLDQRLNQNLDQECSAVAMIQP